MEPLVCLFQGGGTHLNEVAGLVGGGHVPARCYELKKNALHLSGALP